MNVICRLTLGEAIETGLLTDVTAQARDFGIKPPVFISEGIFRSYLNPPSGSDGTTSLAVRELLWKFRVLIENVDVTYCLESFLIPLETSTGVAELFPFRAIWMRDEAEEALVLAMPHLVEPWFCGSAHASRDDSTSVSAAQQINGVDKTEVHA